MNVTWLAEQDVSHSASISVATTVQDASTIAHGSSDELHGALGEGGLLPLVRWLEGLELSGCLRLWRADWNAELTLDRGQLVVSTGNMRGQRALEALEAIVLALAEAQFAFIPGLPSSGSSTPALMAELERLVSLYDGSPVIRPELVPRLVGQFDNERHDSVLLEHSALGTLLAIDGLRTVADLVAQYGFPRAVLDLSRLWQSGLIAFAELQARPPGSGEPGSVVVDQPGLPEQVEAAGPRRARPPWRHWSRNAAVGFIAGALLIAAVTLAPRVGPISMPSASEQPAVESRPAATATPAPTVAVPSPSNGRTLLLDEQFTGRQLDGWPNDPNGFAWSTGAGYEILTRHPDNFVAIGVPGVGAQHDVVLTARFHKVGGPPGGGYGLIVRDQGPGPRDGLNQAGNFYLLEVDDSGQVGAWRRAGQQWLDLLPWAPSMAVQPGTAASNELQARVIGNQLSLLVNGIQVLSLSDAQQATGGVGIFVGGNSNDIILERLVAQTPD